ncbi:hypothetical protein B0H11DRAFT_635853 [Mycena galericulata]|nr:hypothetical protein B0H11DRAFT_635853 [Mycena galericulata]
MKCETQGASRVLLASAATPTSTSPAFSTSTSSSPSLSRLRLRCPKSESLWHRFPAPQTMTFVSPRASSLSPQFFSLSLPCYPLHSPTFLINSLRFLVASRSLGCPHWGIRTHAPPGDFSTARTAYLSLRHGPRNARIDGTCMRRRWFASGSGRSLPRALPFGRHGTSMANLATHATAPTRSSPHFPVASLPPSHPASGPSPSFLPLCAASSSPYSYSCYNYQ